MSVRRSFSSSAQAFNSHIPKSLKLLSGENYKTKHLVTHICPYTNEDRKGHLSLTNYRLYFEPFPLECRYSFDCVDLPLGLILKIKKVNLFNKHKSLLMEISCKDTRKVWFEYQPNSSMKEFMENINKFAFPLNFQNKLFAFSHVNRYFKDGWNVYEPKEELKRMGLTKDQVQKNWRITKINENYSFCDSYPAVLAVNGTNNKHLQAVAKFRSKNRLPVLSWIHPRANRSITRCSQPLIGVYGQRSQEDEQYLDVIRRTASRDDKLIIIDARPFKNAMANKAFGGGYEVQSFYSNTDVIFMNIENIHVIRESFAKLKSLCFNPPEGNDKWKMALSDTAWLKHIKNILTASIAITEHINNGYSVVVHCSDGWDRTSQLTSLAMLMLDPYYREIQGFQVLIEKEWLSFGHKFQQRCGHGDMNYSDQQKSPIFMQFIDCVWQIHRQYPSKFEFNEKFLLTILNELYTCRFGTFLCDTERERIKIKSSTTSLWSWMNASLENYTNPEFNPKKALFRFKPSTDVVLWENYYCQWNKERNEVTHPYMKTLQHLKRKTNFMNELWKIKDSSNVVMKFANNLVSGVKDTGKNLRNNT